MIRPNKSSMIETIIAYLGLVLLFIFSGYFLLGVFIVALNPHQNLKDEPGLLLFFALAALGFYLSNIWSDLFRRLVNRAEKYVVALSISTSVICVIFFWYSFRNEEFNAHISNFGSTGDFFGGILGTIFSFLALFLVIKQNGEFAQREEKRDILSRADFKGQQFYRDIDFIEKKYNSITGETGKKGVDALAEYLASVIRPETGDVRVPTILKVSTISCAVIISLVLDEFYKEFTKDNLTPEEAFLYNKQYQYLISIIPRGHFNDLASVVELINSDRPELQFLLRIRDMMSINEDEYPSAFRKAFIKEQLYNV